MRLSPYFTLAVVRLLFWWKWAMTPLPESWSRVAMAAHFQAMYMLFPHFRQRYNAMHAAVLFLDFGTEWVCQVLGIEEELETARASAFRGEPPEQEITALKARILSDVERELHG